MTLQPHTARELDRRSSADRSGPHDRLLDTGPEEAFDRLARLASVLLKVPYAFVTVVDGSRSFWKSCIGTGLTDLADRQNAVEASFCQYVIETDEPLIVGDARENPLTRANPSIEAMGVLAWAGFPIRSADGHVLGTFCAVDIVPRQWTAAEIETLASLAQAVEGEMRLRIALDVAASSTRLLHYEMQVSRAPRDALQGSRHGEFDRCCVDSDRRTRWVGARRRVRQRRPARCRTAQHRHPGARQHRRRDRVAVPHHPGQRRDADGDAVRRVDAVLLRDHADHVPRYEHLLADATAAGLIATAAMPLVRSDGTVVGVLGVGWARACVFTTSEMALLETVAMMCAQAIERAQVGDMRRQMLETLQRQLLPAVPRIAGLDIAVRYVAATYQLGFGGDWYDIVALPDGRSAFVIGDIAGHGIEAAARMAQVRSAVNALVRLHADDLPSVFDAAEEMLCQPDDVYVATIAVFVLDSDAGEITYVSAGHPPAIVMNADGTTIRLDGGRRALLGQGGRRPPVGRATFVVGSVLVAYTDGLIERRRESLEARVRLLENVLHATSSQSWVPSSSVADIVLDSMRSERSDDDVALVVVRRRD